MSSANPAWLIAQAVKTELDAAFASPTDILEGADFGAYSPQDISVIPPGEEDTRPAPGKTSWINIYVPEDTALVWETGNSYLAKPNIRVRICVEEVKRRGSLHEQVLALAHFVTVALTRSTLDNLARRAPRQTASSTHLQKGATQTWVSEIRLEYEYQGRGGHVTWPVEVLAYREQAGQNISLNVEGLAADEYRAVAADGSVLTLPTTYAGTSGTGRVAVLNAADITKITNVTLVITAPEPS